MANLDIILREKALTDQVGKPLGRRNELNAIGRQPGKQLSLPLITPAHACIPTEYRFRVCALLWTGRAHGAT